MAKNLIRPGHSVPSPRPPEAALGQWRGDGTLFGIAEYDAAEGADIEI